MSESTKYYSSIQEGKIAKYLGWNTVSGSGARDTRPGDVNGGEWLAECKTHVKRHPVEFKSTTWAKIAQEAASVFKYPISITDCGTQYIEDTWCMIRKNMLDTHDNVIIRECPIEPTSKGNISFHGYQLNQIGDPSEIRAFSVNLKGEELVIMPVPDFKTIFIDKV